MRYRILGPLRPAVTAGRDRIVLAMMLLRPGRVVSVPELVDAVWGDDPPSTVRTQLQACVSRLRRALPAGAIDTDPAGYRLRIAADDLDSLVFARLIARARAEGDAVLFREALDLWRGEALVGIDSRPVRAAAAGLDEQYVAAVEDWAELELAAGRDRELLGLLGTVVERFPLRERLRGQMIRAMAGAGRTADALAEFRRTREVLRGELGIEPGKELQEVHRRVLTGGETAPVRSLPRTVGDFTGREDVVARLLAELDRCDPAISVIDGMAGSGKTTLALHVASLVGERYPDAHLFVDLLGHSAEQPLEPAAALLILLRQLGVPAETIPVTPGDRVTLWRSELARRRVLLVLDNAHSSAQVADLLPTVPGSLALVTSRRRLVGLDGVHSEPLVVLTPGEATVLLARIVGERVRAEPAALAEVVRRCGGLPLALRLAGARLAHRRRWRVADLVLRLGESALPELAVEDRSVADAFALSYGQLTAPAQRMFRLLGVCPAPLFDAPAAAALAGLPLDEAQDLLDDLHDVHLIDEPAPGIFRLHDLLREFAAALAADLSPDERRTAVEAILDLQTHAFAAANPPSWRAAVERDIGPLRPLRPDLVAALPDPAARVEWERPQLPAYLEAAAADGEYLVYAWWLPRAAWWFLYDGGYTAELRRLLERSLAMVEKAGDRAGIAVVSNYLASSASRIGELDRAAELLRLSRRVQEELGNRRAVAVAQANLANVYDAMGRFAESVAAARESLRLRYLVGERVSNRTPLHNLADALDRLGRHEEALRARRLGMLDAIEVGDATALANCLQGIQRHRIALGQIDLATAHRYLRAALRLSIRNEHLFSEADIRSEQGRLLRAEGRYAEAIALHLTAVELTRKTADRRYESAYTVDLADTRRAAGDRAGALADYRRALRDAEALGLRYTAARARAGLAECLADTDPESARRSWTAALVEFREMGVPEQHEAERRLAAMPR
ncbi:tetratricopeptide repeat protein [Actinoplanes sp. KI2]|uniref:AfsR/SARP family transcriptional regulator n=1 Tax=Actinoplanes sp. KI2 TaxID=2983315 RepID=UPI0021D58A19|nr:AfsR/SARP family transcriptional regulator [Actinoplanes sp. KI2]MCU7727226.1 tetratricopeptide repeat protein [Actinoplanes sp. KI2]